MMTIFTPNPRRSLLAVSLAAGLALTSLIVEVTPARSQNSASKPAEAPSLSVQANIESLMQSMAPTFSGIMEIFESDPEKPYRTRNGINRYALYNTDDTSLKFIEILHDPARNRFYIENHTANKPTFYGPIDGDPFKILYSSSHDDELRDSFASDASAKKPLKHERLIQPDNALGLEERTIIALFKTCKRMRWVAQAISLNFRPGHDQIPGSIEELSKKYINGDELTRDPFCREKLRLQISEKDGRKFARVFSVGPDGIWDEGKLISAKDPNLRGDIGAEIDLGEHEVRWLMDDELLKYFRGNTAPRYLAKRAPLPEKLQKTAPIDEKLKFGEPVDGLRAAVELVTTNGSFVIGQPVKVKFHIQNATNYTIQVADESWIQGYRPIIQDESGGPAKNDWGKPVGQQEIYFSGYTPKKRAILNPGDSVFFDANGLVFGAAAKHPIGHSIGVGPGHYTLQFRLALGRFGGWKSELMDWSGELETGSVSIELKDDVNGDFHYPKSEWGPSVEGLSVRLRADKVIHKGREIPSLKAAIRNEGQRSFMTSRQQEAARIEVDGLWYRWVNPSQPNELVLRPGDNIGNIMVTLGDYWREEKTTLMRQGKSSLPTKLTPGKHTIRFAAAVSEYLPLSKTTPFWVNSDSIEIEHPTRTSLRNFWTSDV